MDYVYVDETPSGHFKLIEKGSEVVLLSTKSKRKVKTITKSLEEGAGFAGHTPPFMALFEKSA